MKKGKTVFELKNDESAYDNNAETFHKDGVLMFHSYTVPSGGGGYYDTSRENADIYSRGLWV